MSGVLRRIPGPVRDEVTGVGADCIIRGGRGLCFVPLAKYHLGDRITQNGMGEACCTYGAEESCIQGICEVGGRT